MKEGGGMTPKQKEYSRAYYAKNRVKKRNAHRAYRIEAKIKRRQLLLEMLGGKCVRCGVDDPLLLDFDHIDPKTKVKRMSQMLVWMQAWSDCVAEAKKCQLLCANCHRIKTYAPERFLG